MKQWGAGFTTFPLNNLKFFFPFFCSVCKNSHCYDPALCFSFSFFFPGASDSAKRCIQVKNTPTQNYRWQHFYLLWLDTSQGIPTPRGNSLIKEQMWGMYVYKQLFQVNTFMARRSLDSALSHIPQGIEEKTKTRGEIRILETLINRLLKIFADYLQ